MRHYVGTGVGISLALGILTSLFPYPSFAKPPASLPAFLGHRVHVRLSEEEYQSLGRTRDRSAIVVDAAPERNSLTVITEGDHKHLFVKLSEVAFETLYPSTVYRAEEISFTYRGILYQGTIANVFTNGKIKIRFEMPSTSTGASHKPFEIWRTSREVVVHPRCIYFYCVGDEVQFKTGIFEKTWGRIARFERSPTKDVNETIVVIEYQGGTARRYFNYISR